MTGIKVDKAYDGGFEDRWGHFGPEYRPLVGRVLEALHAVGAPGQFLTDAQWPGWGCCWD
jgi:hypothetical protein